MKQLQVMKSFVSSSWKSFCLVKNHRILFLICAEFTLLVFVFIFVVQHSISAIIMLLNRNSIHCACTILTRTQTKNLNKMSPLLTVHVPFFYLSFPFSNFSRVHARWNNLKSSGDNHI